MLDLSHIPSQYPNADVQVFVGQSGITNVPYATWQKPRGKSMCHILLVGPGGNGGTGIVGANSLAGGGGGGGSGGQTSVRFPLWAVPDILYIQSPAGGSGQWATVSIAPDGNQSNRFMQAVNGGNGGNGTAVPAGGAAGAAGTIAIVAQMPLGWQWLQQALAGQAGLAGTASTNGAQLNLPTTGILVSGGGGGSGLPAAATVGTAGGFIASAGVFPNVSSAAGGTSATTPPSNGATGFNPIANLLYGYGGLGGGSTHGSATGAGLVQASGGDGAPGCGGGGMGAALTGSTPGVVGKGGPAFCIITCW